MSEATSGVRATRPTFELDGEWRFVADSERLHGPSGLPEGEPIQVPGCWEAQVARPYRIVSAWYHRRIRVPSDWPAGGRLLLRFGAVMYRCAVYVDGERIGVHEGGYTPFTLELPEHTQREDEHQLAVEVVNPLNAIVDYPAFSVERLSIAQEFEPDLPLSQAPHGKQTWYSSQSGIWQSVRLEWVPDRFIERLSIRPDLAGGRALVRWTLGGRSPDRGGPTIRLRVLDPDGRAVGEETVSIGQEESGDVALAIPEPRGWDIGSPNLYRLEARLGRAGSNGSDDSETGSGREDRRTERFGMRDIAVADGHVVLNGRSVYLLGALDQDLYPDTISTPPSRAFLDRQLQLAREMGLNLLRCHIKVPDPAYLDAADEAGILLWCELPNWKTFTFAAARRGRATLREMVDALGNHPSVVIWTIINEDWGTRLRYEARDRYWLRRTYDWLKELDPSRLVVDNSACETAETPNFHVKTDLADFHIYFGMPDNAVRWRGAIADYARRPSWLWSPHGDASQTGEEPLVLSEFGNWGLPRLDRLLEHQGGREPWWFGTGQGYYLPTGVARRFKAQGLDRIWPDVNALAEATQWHQFTALQYEIGQLRRHDSIKGYVITEFTDAYWEANGLLDAARGPKAFHDRLAELNAADAVVADVARHDVCSGDDLTAEVVLSSYGPPPLSAEGGRIDWRLRVADGQAREGTVEVVEWPVYRARVCGRISVEAPAVAELQEAWLELTAIDGAGQRRAHAELRLVIMPASARHTERPRDLAVLDPEEVWGLADRLRELGHRIVPVSECELLVTSVVDRTAVRHAEDGGRVLVLVRSRDAVPTQAQLARRLTVQLRRLPSEGWPGQRSPWDGDWVTSFSWLLPGLLDGLPDRNPLDFAYAEVMPDHVFLGYEPAEHLDEVGAGMFVGWVHAPAALLWAFRQGRGAVTLTTFHVCPENGPVATAMLEALVAYAVEAERRADERRQPTERVA